MHNFWFLICASLFMALSAGALTETMDYTGLCLKCADENAFPDCLTNETTTHLNLTIYCQKSNEHYCTLGIVNGSEEDVFSRDLVCRLRHTSLDLEKIQSDQDDFKIISITKEQVKPLPLLLQETTEAVRTTTDGSNIQILSITQEDIEPSKTDSSHMAIVASPDAMAALEDGTDAENADVEDAAAASEDAAAEVDQLADPETPAEPAEEAAAEVDAETVADETELANEEVAEAPEPPAEAPEPPAEAPEPPAEAPEPPAEAPEPPAEAPEPPAEEPIASAATESDKNEAAVTDTEADKDPETPSNTDSMDYQGDEAKPDAEATPAGETDVSSVKVPDNPVGGKEPVLPLMKYYACTSLSYVNCTEQPDTEIDCRSADEGTNIKNGCYTLFKGTQLQRGCLADLAPTELKNCLNANSSTCRTCETSGCNNASWPQCYNCDSSKESLCAWWPTEAVNQVQRTICPKHTDRCISRVDEAGVTQRSCADASLNCATTTTEPCASCADSFCNGGVFPASRQRCLQCAGDAACPNGQSAPLPCLLYRPDERCFYYVNTTNQMIRGCASDATEFEGCRMAAGKCVQCATTDGCNDTPLMKPPKLQCSRCNSLNTPSEYATCVWSQEAIALSLCVKKYPYYLQESCLSIYNPEMKWAIRDCSLDFGACEPTDQLCHSCTTDGCNGDNMEWQHCLQCNSATESSCASDVTAFKPQRCAASVQPYKLRGCYTWFSVDTNTTSRGCISDLAVEDIEYCKENIKLCTLCYKQGCNNRSTSLANYAVRMDMSMILGMLLAVVIASYQ